MTRAANAPITNHLVTLRHPKTGVVSVFGPSHLVKPGWVRAQRGTDGTEIDAYLADRGPSFCPLEAIGTELDNQLFAFGGIDLDITGQGKDAWERLHNRNAPSRPGRRCTSCGEPLKWLDRHSASPDLGLCYDCA